MADQVQDVNVQKSGESVLMVSLQRCHGGVRVFVKVHPSIERLMQEWSSGEKVAVARYGANWSAENGSDLMAYAIADPFSNVRLDRGVYSLDKLGGVLFRDEASSNQRNGELNFSFIRLVGASEGAGITFTVKGAYSLDFLRTLQDRIKDAGKRFYQDYLCPVDLTVSVVTQSTKL